MSNMLQHRGYLGSVLYSDEDETFHGRLEHIRDLVTYEGSDAASLKNAFREAVDDYLRLCEEQGRSPDVPLGNGLQEAARSDVLREQILALALHDDPQKGVLFERWLVETLPLIPATEVARAWRWQDSPTQLRQRAFGRAGNLPDTGVDILAERHDGGLIAVQAKCLRPDRSLVLDDLKQFWLKVKGNRKLAANWIVTTGEWGRTVEAHAADAGGALINAQSKWGDTPTRDLGRSKPLELDDNQKAAWRACVDGFRDEDRGKLVMACGTGKTLVSLRVAERVAPPGGLVVYATPSIALTGQSRRSWLQNAKRPIRTMVVCSDEDEGAGGGAAAFTGFVSEIEAPVSTDPRAIADTVRELQRSVEGTDNGLVAIFATYQSLHRVCTAQKKHRLPDVDLVIADEAHRTAGKYDRESPGPFQVVHHRLRAAKRLYQTATPRIYSKRSSMKLDKMLKTALEQGTNVTIQDMSDQSIYGQQFHRLSFREALQAENPRLCDYRVIVLGTPLTTEADAIREDGEVRENDDVENTSRNTRVAALAQAMQYRTDDMEDIRSCIAFCNRVSFAAQASRLLRDRRLARWAHRRALAQGKAEKGTRPVEVGSGSLSAKDNAKRRGDELQRLREANGVKHITTNVNVLSEGIDVPALDAICFLDERKSEVEIVQAVGRVMRRPAHGDKKHGYIVVPVVMSPQTSLEESLATGGGDWSVVGQVLRALKAHDDRIETDLTDVLRVHPPPNGSGGGGGGEALDFWQKLARGEFDALAPVLAESGILGDQRAQTANLIKSAVAAAAHSLAEETGMGRALAPVVGVADLREDAELRACTQAALILMNACLVHERLVQTGSAIELPKLDETKGDISRRLARAWRKILAHDYKPIFQPAVDVLAAADMGQKRTPQGVKYALYGLAEHAVEVAEKYAAAGMDHAGELFQAAMDNPQADGAYYTLTPGAMLLAELACDLYAAPNDPLWRKPSTWSKIAMMDPACGSGTLLVAFASAVRRRAAEQGAKQKRLENIHKALVEHGMIGLDINRRAVQIAAAQLTIGGLSADFRNMGLWTMPRGRRSGWRHERSKTQVDDVMLGSLELLFDDNDGSASSFERAIGESAAANRDRHRRSVEMSDDQFSEGSGMMEGLGRLAIALTNPPFSSLKNLAADVDADVRTALVGRMANLRENVGARWQRSRDAMSADSISPPYSFILSERIHRKHGVVGKVMPTTACTNSAPAGIAERRLLADQFEIDMVISLHDPKAYAWSVKGHQESLLLMRRQAPGQRSETARFVSVRRRPSNTEDAIQLYDGVRSGDIGDLGRICEWPRERIEAGDWSPAVFYEPELAETCYQLDQLPAASSERFAHLGDLYDVNTTKQTVGQSKWEWCHESEAEVAVAKSASESGQRRIRGVVDGWARRAPAHRNRDKERQLLLDKAGCLLITNTQDASSGRLTAVAFHAPVVGYAWTPVQDIEVEDAQALAVWLNSTLGRILLRKYGSRRANWPMYQPAAIKQLVVPNTAGKHWRAMRQPLLDAYRATKDTTVPRYREPNTEVRRAWDRAAARAGGFPARTVNRWRTLMDAEPFVSGRDT